MIGIRNAVEAVRAYLRQIPDLIQVSELQLEEFDYDDCAGVGQRPGVSGQ